MYRAFIERTGDRRRVVGLLSRSFDEQKWMLYSDSGQFWSLGLDVGVGINWTKDF